MKKPMKKLCKLFLFKNELRADYGPQAKFLEICDSGGAIHLKNALLTSPESVKWDHEFLSPTFKDTLERHIVDYVKNYGGKR